MREGTPYLECNPKYFVDSKVHLKTKQIKVEKVPETNSNTKETVSPVLELMEKGLLRMVMDKTGEIM